MDPQSAPSPCPQVKSYRSSNPRHWTAPGRRGGRAQFSSRVVRYLPLPSVAPSIVLCPTLTFPVRAAEGDENDLLAAALKVPHDVHAPPSLRPYTSPCGASSSGSGPRALRHWCIGLTATVVRVDGGRVVSCRRRGGSTLLAAARLAGSCGGDCRTCGGFAYGTRCARCPLSAPEPCETRRLGAYKTPPWRRSRAQVVWGSEGGRRGR
jgi:hypothetical protein